MTPPHLAAPLAAAAATHPARPFTASGDRVRSCAEVAALVSGLAARFEDAPGWAPGARVAVVWGSNQRAAPFAGDDAFAAILAATVAGGVAAPVNGRLPPAALGACLAGVEAAVVVVCSGAAGAAAANAALAAAPRPARPGGGGRDDAAYLGLPRGPVGGPALLLVLGRDDRPLPRGWTSVAPPIASPPTTTAPTPRLRSNAPAIAALVFTSGSSGPPKAAALTHAALAWAGQAKAAACGYGAADTYLHAAPLCHIGGVAGAAAVLASGGCHVFLAPATGGAWPRDGPGVSAALAGVTALAAVPASLVDIGASPGAPYHSVRAVLVGGGALSAGGLAAARAALPAAALHGAYGLTEAGSSVTYVRLLAGGGGGRAGAAVPLRPPPGAEGAVWVGGPPPGAVVCVAVPAPGTPTPKPAILVGGASSPAAAAVAAAPALPAGWAPAPRGSVGAVLTATPSAAAGYFRDAAATAATFLRGRGDASPTTWLVTGDVGAVDPAAHGLWLVGRGRDVIRVGGETVHAAAVDAALGGVPGLAGGLAVAVPDDRLGAVVGALVVVRRGVAWAGPGPAGGGGGGGATTTALTPAAVAAACRSAGLPGFALPRVVVGVRGGLPTVPGTAKPCRRAAAAVVAGECSVGTVRARL